MTPPKSRRAVADQESTPQLPQATPQSVGYGFGADHSFTLQAIMELQKSVGEMNAILQGVKQTSESTKAKVDNLVEWKNKILGGAAVLTVVVAAIGYFLGKASDYVMLKPSAIQNPAAGPAPSASATKP